MGAAPSNLPAGTQMDTANRNMTCKVFDQYDTFNTTITTIAPITAGSGQQIYFADITVSIQLPDVFQSSAVDFGPNYTVYSNISLGLTNAAPSSFFLSETVQAPTKTGFVRIPESGVLPPVGPAVLGHAGDVSLLYLGGLNLSVAVGSAPSAPAIPIECDRSSPDFIVSAIAVVG